MDNKIISSLRGLSIDMINNANSGHPGVALGACPILYTLYSKHLNFDLENDKWINRDRFVLSGGHASALLYSMLYYIGYLSLDDLKKFRTINSNTPGHPEITTKGVDASTGPLGSGIATAVGMAIAEAYYESTLGNDNINYHTYVMCGDGDLEEGISYEAMSLAGTLKLRKLIVLYDSNDISLDGKTSDTFNDDIKSRVKAMGWNYIKVTDGESVEEIDNAIGLAKNSSYPTLIEIKTIIGVGSMKEGTNKVHGSPLTKEDIIALKGKLNLPIEPFYVDERLVTEFRNNLKSRMHINDDSYVLSKINQNVDLLSLIKPYYETIDEALRETNGKIMTEIANNTYNFIGGAADLSSSTKAYLKDSGVFNNNDYTGRNIFFGVREHAMGAISNGMALCGLRPFASTFLVFSDYMKPAIRMSALMNLPVAYVYTHDSINVGEDGATHEPIEQLGMLRGIPNLNVYRPADANEILGSWNMILNSTNPSTIILSRNASPLLNESKPELVSKGGYIAYNEKDRLNAIIIATGTEVNTAINIAKELEKDNIYLRVVSIPCKEIFEKQDMLYQNTLLPAGYRKIVIEYSNDPSWYKYVYDEKYLVNINSFGKSGHKDEVLEYFKLDYDSIKQYIKELLK